MYNTFFGKHASVSSNVRGNCYWFCIYFEQVETIVMTEVKKGIFSGIPEAVRHERESKSTFFLYFAENFILYKCVSLVRGAQR
jgi:hypothetical protein